MGLGQGDPSSSLFNTYVDELDEFQVTGDWDFDLSSCCVCIFCSNERYIFLQGKKVSKNGTWTGNLCLNNSYARNLPDFNGDLH